MLASSATGGARNAPSRAVPSLGSNLPDKKRQPEWTVFFGGEGEIL